MKYSILFFCLFAQYMIAQLAQGPAAGSVPSGVVISTDSFPAVPTKPMTPHRSNPFHKMPNIDIANEGGTAPSISNNASNYVIDASVSGSTQIASPAILNSFPGVPMSDTSRPFPYDANIAAGPSHLAAVVNSALRIFDKSGNSLKYIDIYDWYLRPGMPTVYGIADPKIRYDHFAHRWIMVWLGINATSDQNPTIFPDSYFFISISDDANPLGTWYNWAIPSSTNGNTDAGGWADFEGVGFDKDALYITSDQISFSTGANMYAKIRIIPKTQLLANNADSLKWTDFWDIRNNFGSIMRGGSLRPSLIYGSPNEYYVIGRSPAAVKDYFILYRLKDVLTTPTISAVHIPVNPWITTPDAIQYEGGPLLESDWNYLTNEPVYKDSSLWVVHAAANPIATQYSNIRYLRFNTATNTATEDVSFGAVGYSYNYPSIMIDSSNNVGIMCSRSGTTEYPGMYLTGRRTGDPPGLSPSIVLKAGEENHLLIHNLGGARNRWGDYSSIIADPVDGTLLWACNGYAVSSKTIWNTWIGKISMKPTSTANICVDRGMIGFGTFETGQKSLAQKITLSNNGFDTLQITNIIPGPDFKIAYPTSFPKSIAQNDTLEVQILFSPTKSGRCYDTITIFSNDPIKPQFIVLVVGTGTPTSVKETHQMPTVFSLEQNYPNPFNPSTVISYHLPAGQAGLPVISKVTLKIYDVLGREVATQVNEEQSAGWKEVQWNASGVSSGIYFYKLTAGKYVDVKKMSVVK
jgi:hypothetical protein